MVAAVVITSFVVNRHYPLSVLSGEKSVGTWVSVFLLSASTAFAFVIMMKKGFFPWMPVILFLFTLAIDERFMFHESLKEMIIFSQRPHLSPHSLWGELPVILAGIVGGGIVLLIWKNIQRGNRLFILLAMCFGGLSVLLDVTNRLLIVEDLAKICGELFLAICFLREVGSAQYSRSN